MPHVAFVPFTGLRVREREMLELGMRLPGLRSRADAVTELPALGLLTLAGLTPAHWSVSYQPVDSSTADSVDEVMSRKPDLIAVSALTASIEEAYAFSTLARRYGVPVVIGGLHATACPEEARRYCDAVVIGEGEAVWPQILEDAVRGELRPVYRAAAQPRFSDWAPPRFDLLSGRRPARFTLQTERGCPFACEFCGASRLLGGFREKPVASIVRELEMIASLDSQPLVELADDNTFAGAREPQELFAAFERFDVRYFTEADWRIGERPDVLAGLARSGCAQMLVGIESLVFRYPGMGAKQAELGRIMAAVEAIQQAGVVVAGCFILGGDGETRASIDRLVQFVLDSPLAEVQLTLQTPFPGTPLYRRLAREGRLLAARGWSAYTLFDVTFQPDRLSVGDLERGFREAVAAVFSAPAVERRRRLRRRIWRNSPGLRRNVPCEDAP